MEHHAASLTPFSSAAPHGGRVYQYARESGLAVTQIMDFSANINPHGPPASVRNAILQALPLLRHYPDRTHAEVKAVIAAVHGVSPANIICGNGAMEAMELVVRDYRPRRLLILVPGFSEYEAIAHRHGVPVVRISLVPDSGFALPIATIDELAAAGDLLVINNPHNPSGRHWPLQEWEDALLRWNSCDIRVLVDESFIDFLPSMTATALPFAVRLQNVSVIRSATKVFSIPGLRFGFAVTHADLARQIEGNRDGWSVNHLAQAAAVAAYRDAGFLDLTRRRLRADQQYIRATWGAHGAIRLHDMSANFFLARFADQAVTLSLQVRLRQDGIFVRDAEGFAGLDARYIRCAILQRAANERLWELVQGVLNET